MEDTERFRKVYAGLRKVEAETLSSQYRLWDQFANRHINAIDVATIKRQKWTTTTEITPVDSMQSKKLYPKTVDDLNPLESTFTVKPNEGTTRLFLDQWRQGLGLPTRDDDVAIEQFKQARKRQAIENFKSIASQTRTSEYKLKEGNEIIGLAKNLYGAILSQTSSGPLMRISQALYDKLLMHADSLQPIFFREMKNILNAITNTANTGRLDLRIIQAFKEVGSNPPPNVRTQSVTPIISIEKPTATAGTQTQTPASGIPSESSPTTKSAGQQTNTATDGGFQERMNKYGKLEEDAKVQLLLDDVQKTEKETIDYNSALREALEKGKNFENVDDVLAFITEYQQNRPAGDATGNAADAAGDAADVTGGELPSAASMPSNPLPPLTNDAYMGLIKADTPASNRKITPTQLIAIRDQVNRCHDIVDNGLAKSPAPLITPGASYPLSTFMGPSNPQDQSVSLQQFNMAQQAKTQMQEDTSKKKAEFKKVQEAATNVDAHQQNVDVPDVPKVGGPVAAQMAANAETTQALQGLITAETETVGNIVDQNNQEQEQNATNTSALTAVQEGVRGTEQQEVAQARAALQPPPPTSPATLSNAAATPLPPGTDVGSPSDNRGFTEARSGDKVSLTQDVTTSSPSTQPDPRSNLAQQLELAADIQQGKKPKSAATTPESQPDLVMNPMERSNAAATPPPAAATSPGSIPSMTKSQQFDNFAARPKEYEKLSEPNRLVFERFEPLIYKRGEDQWPAIRALKDHFNGQNNPPPDWFKALYEQNRAVEAKNAEDYEGNIFETRPDDVFKLVNHLQKEQTNVIDYFDVLFKINSALQQSLGYQTSPSKPQMKAIIVESKASSPVSKRTRISTQSKTQESIAAAAAAADKAKKAAAAAAKKFIEKAKKKSAGVGPKPKKASSVAASETELEGPETDVGSILDGQGYRPAKRRKVMFAPGYKSKKQRKQERQSKK